MARPWSWPTPTLVTAEGVVSSRNGAVRSERIQWLETQPFAKPLVHIVDREADSVAHLRRWSQAGYAWLIRSQAGCPGALW